MYVRMLAMVNIDIILEASQKLTVVCGGWKHGEGGNMGRVETWKGS